MKDFFELLGEIVDFLFTDLGIILIIIVCIIIYGITN